MNDMDPVEPIARATRYAGSVLWPVRRTALKNQCRWTFGGPYPSGFCDQTGQSDTGPDDGWQMRCEALLDVTPKTRLSVELRFLHVVHRQVRAERGGHWNEVGELEVAGPRQLTWDEAAERRIVLPELYLLPGGGYRREEPWRIEGRHDQEPIVDEAGTTWGARLRRDEPLCGMMQLEIEPVDDACSRLTITLRTDSHWWGSDRSEAQRRSTISTHLVLAVDDGAFHAPAP